MQSIIGKWQAMALAICLAAQLLHAGGNVFAQRRTGQEQPTGPRDYRSPHFLVHTDLSPAEAKELMTRLETMLSYVADYWGRPPSGTIECYVVKDLANWPEGSLANEGRVKIARREGITLSQRVTQGDRFIAKAVVYSIADRGTPQHEAVHAYCSQTFGTTGPVWYAEGMAEIGQYWREGELAVNAHPEVIKYLRNAPPKKLTDVVAPLQFTGDSWQNYSWRWALCYLLANNPNYAPRFLPLGKALLAEQDVTFEQVYGPMAQEITFEYLFFLQHLEAGYRADLCSWDWSKEFRPLKTKARSISARIEAGRGWQPSGLTLDAGSKYTFKATGSWKTAKRAASTNADGNSDGSGKLVGIVMHEFELSQPFELGAEGEFTAPTTGNLYLRCRDHWIELADNSGRVTVKLSATGETGPIPSSAAPSLSIQSAVDSTPATPQASGIRQSGRILKIN